jgi:hypothetical protein
MAHISALARKLRNGVIMAMSPLAFVSSMYAQSPPVALTCSGPLEFEQLNFSFTEIWMESYSFWIDDSLGFDASISKNGVLFFDINGITQTRPATIRMLTSQGDCFVQVETKSLGAMSLQAFIDTDPADDKDFNYVEAINALVGYSVPSLDHQRIVRVTFTTELDAVRVQSRTALILDDEIIYID